MRSSAVLTLLIYLSLPVFGRMKVAATYKGQPVNNAEVCFYYAQSADPRVGLLSPGLRCFPAGKILDVPARTYGWYVRAGDELVMPHHGLMTGTGKSDGLVTEHNVTLARGAHLEVSGIPLGDGEHFSLIVTGTLKNRAAAGAADIVQDRILVPADDAQVEARWRAGAACSRRAIRQSLQSVLTERSLKSRRSTRRVGFRSAVSSLEHTSCSLAQLR